MLLVKATLVLQSAYMYMARGPRWHSKRSYKPKRIKLNMGPSSASSWYDFYSASVGTKEP